MEKYSNSTKKIFFNKMLTEINPFKSTKVKSFKIPLDRKIILNIKKELLNFKKAKNLNTKTIFYMKKVLNKSDTRDFLTTYTQEILKNKKIKFSEEIVSFLSAVKIASIASIFPIRYNSARKALELVNRDLENFALFMAKKYSNNFSQKLNDIFKSKNEFINKKQKIIEEDVDKIRNFFWNKLTVLSEIISKEVFLLTNYQEKYLQNSYLNLIEYQVLFNETSSFINDKKSDSLVKNLGFEILSKNISRKYKNFGKNSEQIINNYSEFQTHISETSEKISLSDLPPLKPSSIVSLIFSYITIIIWAIIILFPIFQILVLSFDGSGVNTLGDNENVGGGFSLTHYDKLFNQTDFGLWMLNSIIVAISTMIITVVFTTFLAYAFSRFRFKGKKSSLIIVLILQLVPSVAALTAFLVLFQLTKIPLLVFLVIIYSGGAITGNTFIIKGYLDSIPYDLDEAAKIDGSSNLKVFRSILVPIAKPIIAIVALWSFIGPFGDIILPILLTDGSANSVKELTMAAGLRTLVISTSPGAPVFQYEYLAGAIITSIPITLLFIFAQKFIVGGLTSGAVK